MKSNIEKYMSIPCFKEIIEKMTKEGLFSALEKGIFADIKRPFDGGKGLAGVFEKGENYYNPFIDLMKGKGGQE